MLNIQEEFDMLLTNADGNVILQNTNHNRKTNSNKIRVKGASAPEKLNELGRSKNMMMKLDQ